MQSFFFSLADIHKEISTGSKGAIHVEFNYAKTNDNAAELITRDVSLDNFKAQFLFWLHGPSWLVGEALQLPARELGCLSAESCMLVLNNAVGISLVGFASSAIVQLERF